MADETTTTIANLLREFRGPLVEALNREQIFLNELRRDKDPKNWDGSQVSVPVLLADLQGAGMITETGTVNTPLTDDTAKAKIQSGFAHVPISMSTAAVKASKDTSDTSWAKILPLKMKRAQTAIKRIINEQMLGAGDALIAAVTATNGGSTTVTVGTSANFYQLNPGRVVDVLQRSNGATITGGSANKIVSTDSAAGTVTLTTSVSVTNAHGLYILGSYGNAIQGVGQIFATSGTFENINMATNQVWRGNDASPTSASDPTISVFDKADRTARNASGKLPEFYLADIAVQDKYSQIVTTQARWGGDVKTLKTGWTGVQYRDRQIIGDPDMPPKTVYGVNTEDLAIYTLDDGPDWDEVDSMFKRFNRSLPFEAWLTWMVQLGFHLLNGQVKIGNLNQAA
jgi:hypothetical protein